MDIYFATSKFQKTCNSEKKLRGVYGPRMALLIQQRLLELGAADTLETMRSIVGARCHELTANMKGHLAVDLVHPYRLVFTPFGEPVPLKDDGGLDWSKVKAVEVVDVIDYH
jgi:toxin HigB-1